MLTEIAMLYCADEGKRCKMYLNLYLTGMLLQPAFLVVPPRFFIQHQRLASRRRVATEIATRAMNPDTGAATFQKSLLENGASRSPVMSVVFIPKYDVKKPSGSYTI